MTTTTRTAYAVVDLTAETMTAPARIRLREPDEVHEGRGYWFGADAIVSASVEDEAALVDVLTRWGHSARTGTTPESMGISVTTHEDEVPKGPLMRNGVLFTLWSYAADTVLAW